MIKVRKAILVFTIILIQSVLAISAGVAAIYLTTGNSVPQGILAGNVDIGGMTKIEAAKKVDEYYNMLLGKDSLKIAVEGNGEYLIAFTDIDAAVDSKTTVDTVHNWKDVNYLPNLIKASFGKEKMVISPVIKFNEGKLRQKLLELSQKINKDPTNATIQIENGKVIKKADNSGYTLNVGNAVEVIRKSISKNIESTITFSRSKNFEIETAYAKIKLKDLNDIDLVLANYSTEVIDSELLESIKISADAINGVILPEASSNFNKAVIFSYIELLKKKDAAFENDNEGYDQVASTLYAALLTAGIEKDSITRLPHKLAVEYIKPGLDAWISGSAGDLKFSNTFGHQLAIFTEVKDNRVTVSLAGSIKDKVQNYVLKSVVTQKLKPSIVNLENKDLKPGERVMMNPGKEGMMIDTYRNQELISTDKYEAVSAIAQVGPNTDWENDGK